MDCLCMKKYVPHVHVYLIGIIVIGAQTTSTEA